VIEFCLHGVGGERTSLYLLPGLNYEVSASLIRKQCRIEETGPDALLASVPQSVADYIRSRRLYSSLAPTATSD
jgi:hypothetical protein